MKKKTSKELLQARCPEENKMIVLTMFLVELFPKEKRSNLSQATTS
jgi:hypothetical protein